jgi:hypothetical protein
MTTPLEDGERTRKGEATRAELSQRLRAIRLEIAEIDEALADCKDLREERSLLYRAEELAAERVAINTIGVARP